LSVLCRPGSNDQEKKLLCFTDVTCDETPNNFDTLQLVRFIIIFLTNRFQLVLNSAARAVTKTLKISSHYTILKSLHWLVINE